MGTQLHSDAEVEHTEGRNGAGKHPPATAYKQSTFPIHPFNLI